jgi:hypothetical protein
MALSGGGDDEARAGAARTGHSYAAPFLQMQRIGLMLFSTSKPIADANAPKPNDEAPTDDYQSKRVFVRVSGMKKNDKPACDHDQSDACRHRIQHVSETRYHCRSPLRPRQRSRRAT